MRMATQVALATHMRRLGMHDLGAAVMSRADRRAGNQASSLMLLMTQYQGQGNAQLAQQIAFRILQRTQGPGGLLEMFKHKRLGAIVIVKIEIVVGLERNDEGNRPGGFDTAENARERVLA